MANKVLKYRGRVTHQIILRMWRGMYAKELPLAKCNLAHISGFYLISSTGGKKKQLNTKGSEVLSFDFEFMKFIAA